MRYADYEFYADTYGGQIPIEEFDINIDRACLFVRRITFGRADGQYLSEADREAVKMAACAVCEIIYQEREKLKKHGGMQVASENNDGYSISYVIERQRGELYEDVIRRKCYAAAKDYLIFTGLMDLEVDG